MSDQTHEQFEQCPFCKRFLNDPCETGLDVSYCGLAPPTTAPIGLSQSGRYITTHDSRRGS